MSKFKSIAWLRLVIIVSCCIYYARQKLLITTCNGIAALLTDGVVAIFLFTALASFTVRWAILFKQQIMAKSLLWIQAAIVLVLLTAALLPRTLWRSWHLGPATLSAQSYPDALNTASIYLHTKG
ncbi:MAG TPA: hypothetical protein PKD90_09700 [Phnomibacter sp.]|nr:hypothetical protein [Phnomibacter sp.]